MGDQIDGRLYFLRKQISDAQKRKALEQFGNGRKPPPSNDPPRPTRMVKPVAFENLEIKGKAA